LALAHRFGVDIGLDPALALGERITWIQPNRHSTEVALADVCEIADCRVERLVSGFRLVGR
jgi:hypothetical protein